MGQALATEAIAECIRSESLARQSLTSLTPLAIVVTLPLWLVLVVLTLAWLLR